MRTYIFNHTSRETAFEVKEYPYGRLRTSMFYWIETIAKKGDRLVQMTINPKNGRENAPKKSTFSNLMVLFINSENDHIQVDSLGIYAKPEQLASFAEKVGIENLNAEQIKQWRQLNGEVIKPKDGITGDDLKDFKVKWEKDSEGKCNEVRITFDRPDGVTIKEIFEAMKSLNQDRLKEVQVVRNYKFAGDHEGVVRICIRGGMQLTTVSKAAYEEWLASDYATNQKEVQEA